MGSRSELKAKILAKKEFLGMSWAELFKICRKQLPETWKSGQALSGCVRLEGEHMEIVWEAMKDLTFENTKRASRFRPEGTFPKTDTLGQYGRRKHSVYRLEEGKAVLADSWIE